MRIGLSLLVITIFHFVGFSQNAQTLNIPSPNSTNVSVSQLLSLSQIKLWLRADTLISLNPDSTVSSWNDIVANTTFSADPTATQQPTLTVSPLLPGHPSVRFDGVNDGLKAAASVPLRNQKLTLIMVGKIISPTPIGHLVCSGTSAYGDWNFRQAGTGQISFIHGNSNVGAGVTATTTTTQTYLVPQFFMFMATVNPGNPAKWEIYENFSLKDVDNSASYGVGVNNITIGYRSDVTNVFNANFDMSEFIIFDSLIPTADFDLINSYLIDRYSTKVDLGTDITESYSFCPKVLSTNIPFQEYLWSNGLTTPTISVNQSGTYYVKTKDKYGLYSSDTIIVTLPGANNPGDSVICPGNTFVWDTQLDKTGYSFVWQDSSNDSLFVINSAGIYSVTIADSFSCAITQSLSVSVDMFASGISLGPNVSLCAGNSITLASGSSQIISYLWNTSSTNDSIIVNTSGPYSIVVTNANNCTAKDTIIVTVVGSAPVANFSTSIGCINNAVSFTDLSIPPSGNTIDQYDWNFGDSPSATNTSTLSNPVHTYTNTGVYTVSLAVITNTGCTQSITYTINVAPKPLANFTSGTSCQNDSTSFLNQSTGITGYPITTSYWNFGDASPTSTTNITSPKHVFGTPTTYTVKLLVSNNAGCKDSIYNTVYVRSEVKANFTNGPACLNTSTQFQSTSIIPPSGSTMYSWIFPGSTANVPNPIKTFTNSGVYNVTLMVDGNNGCTSTITKLMNVYLPPIASFSIPSFCAKDTVNIVNSSNPQSGIISSYNWRLNNTTFSTIQSPTLSLVNPGNYLIRLTTINSFGCKDSITNSLTIFPLPVVDYTTNPIAFYYVNEPVNFIPSISNASSYLWSINGISTYSIQSPTEIFNAEGSYNVGLNLKDQNGCKGSKIKNITISERYLDLAILNVNTTKDNNGFMTVIADIANYGSVPINTFKMSYQISDGGNIKEDWNGTLNPNSFYTFTFNAVSASLQSSNNNITCVKIEKVNGIIDDNTNNNSFCNSLNSNEINVGNPLPNPTQGDIVLPLTLNRDLDYTIAIYNSIGQIQYEETTKKGVAGLNFVTLNTSSYARGCYIIKIMIDDKTTIKKFIKINNE